MPDPAEGMQDPRAAVVITELVVQLPCLAQFASGLVEAPAELVRAGELERGVGLAPVVADFPVVQPCLLCQIPGLIKAELVDCHPRQGGDHPGLTAAVPGLPGLVQGEIASAAVLIAAAAQPEEPSECPGETPGCLGQPPCLRGLTRL